ncbi:PEP-CTERM sorting domain-containing protein [uncultured Paludibaculum sp.]|uniref:PEP-CTERM sorting domain-containing protein n=1 Tax=uncultured Paludibaculum sp. TaxID=1765020 RepID=UPI002AAB917E|nr:PEP-CTERM sorting domain-containing protein [uncultured Paludibaculum sp.]
MRGFRLGCLCALLLIAVPSVLPAATIINFDEFASPPVTCCYGTTAVTGPLVYSDITIAAGADSGFVMNGDGWDNQQTSGNNLFGTNSGSMILTFNAATDGFSVDIINGTSAATFTLTLFDQLDAQLFQTTTGLNDYGTLGSVGTLSATTVGIWKAVIEGNSNFAIDTVSFNGGAAAVPEPSTLALTGAAALFLSLLRRRRT